MSITIYGTDWCADTRRTRAFLAAKGIRPKFIDIEARPEAARGLSIDGQPISIPILVFDDGSRLDDPTEEQLAEELARQRLTISVRHRTKLNQTLRRFEQYRDDELVSSADFVERDHTIVIVRLFHHQRFDRALEAENLERLTSGLVEIARRSNRTVDIDIGSASAVTPGPSNARNTGDPSLSTIASGTSPLDAETTASALRAATIEGCPLTQRFTELWSSGADHRDATRLARDEGIGRLAAVKGLHALWEMPLTPEAMSLAFNEPIDDDLAAMFHVLGWIIEQNPSSTMSEFQAFDDATGTSVKTHALSLAKRPLDTVAIVDRIGPGLNLRTIDEPRAREMAAATIREHEGLLRIQDQSTLRLSFGWIFLYQSAEYLDTGDYSTMISGNAPLLVDRFTGALWITGTEQRPDVYAENYMATGNPLVSAPSRAL